MYSNYYFTIINNFFIIINTAYTGGVYLDLHVTDSCSIVTGYGDLSPSSVCSKAIAVITGFFGMFCMGITVRILSLYLQLTFDEYCTLSFFIDSDLEKQRKQVGALPCDVIGFIGNSTGYNINNLNRTHLNYKRGAEGPWLKTACALDLSKTLCSTSREWVPDCH